MRKQLTEEVASRVAAAGRRGKLAGASLVGMARGVLARARGDRKLTDILEFLRHYARLRLDVLAGRREATRPLGLRYRWRLWRFNRHRAYVGNREWLGEEANE